MTGTFAVDWMLLGVSLLNTILLLWLGLTVLLNAERRSWGIWLAGGGLLLGGVFFVSHSSMLGHDLNQPTFGLEFWWHVGWVSIVVLPFAWYTLMLWYAGFWARSPRLDRHSIGFVVCVLLAAGLGALFVFADPLPSYGQVSTLTWAVRPLVGGVPLLFLGYPIYVVWCIYLSVDVLCRPSPSQRTIGDLARLRARPWLVGAAVVLLLVGLLVAGGMAWILLHAQRRLTAGLYQTLALTLAWLDLATSSLIAVAVFFLGQAIVSYEVFTGKTLPRRGFQRHWRNAVLLAVGYSTLVSWTLVIHLRPIYVLLLTAIMMVGFGALLSWRSFVERERLIIQLRPFAASQDLYASVAVDEHHNIDASVLFDALCGEVLGASRAFLVPLGPLASLLESPMAYPDGRAADAGCTIKSTIQSLLSGHEARQTAYLALDPDCPSGVRWAVPLWGERGLIGALLLGDKEDGGLYTEEEIEIARSGGERLLDTLAAVETARRLMALLQQRIAQIRLMEGQGRRILHDEVLPQLHAAILYLDGREQDPAVSLAVEALTAAHHQISDLMRDTSPATPQRLAVGGPIAALQALVREDYAGAFDGVDWQIEPQAEAALCRLAPHASEVLYFAAHELIRNAARHGRGGKEGRMLQLRVVATMGEDLRLCIEDDGIGYRAGGEGRAQGHGLRFHSTMLMAIGARLQVQARATRGTRGQIVVPLKLVRREHATA